MKLFAKKEKKKATLADTYPAFAALAEAAGIEQLDMTNDGALVLNAEQISAMDAAIEAANDRVEELEGEAAQLSDIQSQISELRASLETLENAIEADYKEVCPEGSATTPAERVTEMKEMIAEYGTQPGERPAKAKSKSDPAIEEKEEEPLSEAAAELMEMKKLFED